MQLYLNLAMVVCALAGMACGGLRYLGPRKPLYASMIVLGVACIALGRLYQCARLVTGLDIIDIFQLGILGTIGAFSFFFSSNYGQIDSLVDDRSTAFARYRIIASLGPIIIFVLYLLTIKEAYPSEKISYALISASIAAASYFHIKHFLIPDVDYGIVRCLRQFNVIALIYGILCMLELITIEYNMLTGEIVVGILQCIMSALLVPAMDMGVKKWTT